MENKTSRECMRCIQLEERIAELRSELMVVRIALLQQGSKQYDESSEPGKRPKRRAKAVGVER